MNECMLRKPVGLHTIIATVILTSVQTLRSHRPLAVD